MEGDRRPAQAVQLGVNFSSTEQNAELIELMSSISNGGLQ